MLTMTDRRLWINAAIAAALAWASGCAAVAQAAAAAEPADRLPVVVLTGQASRIGYAAAVTDRLKGLAEVVAVGGEPSVELAGRVVKLDPAVVLLDFERYAPKADPAATKAFEEQIDRETGAFVLVAMPGWATGEMVKTAGVEDLDAKPVRGRTFDGRLNDEGIQDVSGKIALAVKAMLDGPPSTRDAACRWAATPPTIDGKLDDPVWEAAAVIDRFPAFWYRSDPGVTTRARLLWDADALYFAATMNDADLKSFGTKRNDHLWNGDVFEMFLKPAADRPAYYEFQVNPKSVILELPFAAKGDDFAKLAALPPLGLSAAAAVDGTLDVAGDRDRGWSVEGRIPWSAFARTGGKPEPGSTWRFALCRYDYGPEGTEPVLTSSAPLRHRSFHRTEDYGRLRFEGP